MQGCGGNCIMAIDGGEAGVARPLLAEHEREVQELHRREPRLLWFLDQGGEAGATKAQGQACTNCPPRLHCRLDRFDHLRSLIDHSLCCHLRRNNNWTCGIQFLAHLCLGPCIPFLNAFHAHAHSNACSFCARATGRAAGWSSRSPLCSWWRWTGQKATWFQFTHTTCKESKVAQWKSHQLFD